MKMAENMVDDSICPICGGSTYQGETISCSTCLHWFHFQCVGVEHEDACVISEDIPFYCPSCHVKQRSIEFQNKNLFTGNKKAGQSTKTKAKRYDKKYLGARSRKKREIKLKISLKSSSDEPAISETKGTQEPDSNLSPDSDSSIEQPLIIDEIAPRTVKVGRRRPSQRQGSNSQMKPEESLGFELQMENLEAFIKDVPCKSLDDFVTKSKTSKSNCDPSSSSLVSWNSVEVNESHSADLLEHDSAAVPEHSIDEVPGNDSGQVPEHHLQDSQQVEEHTITSPTHNFEESHDIETTVLPSDDGNMHRDSISHSLVDLTMVVSDEPGSLEDFSGEVRREPRSLTMRQRFKLEGIDSDDSLLSLDFSGRKKVESKEDLADKALKAQKRRDLESEKKEKIKKKTMDTLLRKKDSKICKQTKVAKSQDDNTPKITYISNATSRRITFPASLQYPLKVQQEKLPPKPILCSVCTKPKKYNCSKTGRPLCSLECYKINLQR